MSKQSGNESTEEALNILLSSYVGKFPVNLLQDELAKLQHNLVEADKHGHINEENYLLTKSLIRIIENEIAHRLLLDLPEPNR